MLRKDSPSAFGSLLGASLSHHHSFFQSDRGNAPDVGV
jgi:hypothetical protein